MIKTDAEERYGKGKGRRETRSETVTAIRGGEGGGKGRERKLMVRKTGKRKEGGTKERDVRD